MTCLNSASLFSVSHEPVSSLSTPVMKMCCVPPADKFSYKVLLCSECKAFFVMSAWLSESGASLHCEAGVKTYICSAFTSLLPELSFLLNCLFMSVVSNYIPGKFQSHNCTGHLLCPAICR